MIANRKKQGVYQFGRFRIDPVHRQLFKDGEPVMLQPKTFELLLLLVENNGEVLEKDELMRRLWPDSFVEESNLSQNIYLLRKLLGESAEGQTYIQTVPKRGYRFTADLEAPPSPPSIAVLPFTNMSADAENDYFCDGLAEELLNALAKLEGLKVAARTSAFSFKGKSEDICEIGQKLNVAAVLEGSVRKVGNRLRITAQLINTADGYHLWSERYDRQLEDVFEIQDEITLAIVEALKVRLLGETKALLLKRYTENIEVYQLYLKGRYHYNKWTGEGLKKAIGYFEQAMRLEPNYVPAYLGLAESYGILWFFGHLAPSEVVATIKATLQRVLEIDGSLAEAHLLLAQVKAYHDWDWPEAEREFRRAIELNESDADAHYWYGMVLACLGRPEEGLAELRQAQQLDPLSLFITFSLGYVLLSEGCVDQAAKEAQKLLEIEPNFFGAHLLLGVIQLLKGECEGAVAEAQQAVSLGGGLIALSSLGFCYGVCGKPDEALQVLHQLLETRSQRYITSSSIAKVYMGLGKVDDAIEWLGKACEERDGELVHAKIDVGWNYLRSDPRFQNLLARMGLLL